MLKRTQEAGKLPGMGREAGRAVARGTGSLARPLLAPRRLGRREEAADAGRSPSSPPRFARAPVAPRSTRPGMAPGQARPRGRGATARTDPRDAAAFFIRAQRRAPSPRLQTVANLVSL